MQPVRPDRRAIALAAALLCLTGVVMAAVGSHLGALEGTRDGWRAASTLHLFNGAALIGVAALLGQRESACLRWGAWLALLGTLVFCGSIYLRALTGYPPPAVTPWGGMLMMAGWLLVAAAFVARS